MGLEKLISIGVAMALLAASTGQLPKALLAVHVAQLRLIKASQASTWPKAYLLPESKAKGFFSRYED